MAGFRVKVVLGLRDLTDHPQTVKIVVNKMNEAGAQVKVSGSKVDDVEVDYRVEEPMETKVRAHAAPIVDQANAELDAHPTKPDITVEAGRLRKTLRGLGLKLCRVTAKVIEWAAVVFN